MFIDMILIIAGMIMINKKTFLDKISINQKKRRAQNSGAHKMGMLFLVRPAWVQSIVFHFMGRKNCSLSVAMV